MPSFPQRTVVDSSVIVKWLDTQQEDYLDQAQAILRDGKLGRTQLLAPHLSWYEAGNALIQKQVTLKQAKEAFLFLRSCPIEFIPETQSLSEKTYATAARHNITYYDAAFVALAKEWRATLVTDNIKHQGKAKGVNVIALKDYQGVV